eukprot:GFKZ01009699.1.p1 GENE.GFKZ01009699.1~~GFKZ01009699.1.p1  ORF type:complete len:202 (+),score=39.61 GFKZ01009699.1:625-1230(+)
MSGVATLKPRKRAFDEMNVDLPHPHQACSPARYVIRPPPLKRGRCTPSTPTTSSLRIATSTNKQMQTTQHHNVQRHIPLPQQSSTPSSPSPSHSSSAAPQTPAQRLSPEEIAALSRHVPRRLKRVVEKMASGVIADKDKVFTVADLREIITSVLAEREQKLSEDFAKVLHERLAEQFRDFTKFNEDYVARQLRGKDLAYLS